MFMYRCFILKYIKKVNQYNILVWNFYVPQKGNDKMKELNIGLIKGRHELPVDDFIIENELTIYTKNELIPIIEDGCKRLGLLRHHSGHSDDSLYIIGAGHISPSTWTEEAVTINLYLTGLTIVSLTAVEYLTRRLGYNVAVYGFNPYTKEYYEQGYFVRPRYF